MRDRLGFDILSEFWEEKTPREGGGNTKRAEEKALNLV